MRFGHNGADGKERSHSSSDGGTFRSRPAPIAFQHPQTAQLLQSPGEAGFSAENSSHVQHYGHHISDWSNYPDQAITSSGQFNHWDDSFIHTAVAAGSRFSDIKAVRFQHREDITPDILQDYAQRTGAIWTEEDDKLLLGLMVNQNESPAVLADLKETWLPWRNVDAIRARIKRQMDLRKYNSNDTSAEASFQHEDYGHNTQGLSSGTLENHTTTSSYSDPGPYAFVPEQISQAFADSDFFSAENEYNNDLMELDEYEYDEISTQKNRLENATIDPQVIMDTEAFVSPPEDVNPSFVETKSYSAGSGDNDPIIGQHEDEYNITTEAFLPAQQHRDDILNPNVFRHVAVNPGHEIAGPHYPEFTAASPSLTGPSTSSEQHYDAFQATPQPILDNGPSDQEQHGSAAGRIVKRRRRRRPQAPEHVLDLAKVKLAGGVPISTIVAEFDHVYRGDSLIRKLNKTGWAVWSKREDQRLLALQEQEGDDWRKISARLAGPSRSPEEVESRLDHLRQSQESGQAPAGSKRYHYTDEEDDLIRLRVAEGMNYVQVGREEFKGLLQPRYVTGRAKLINADWSRADDEKLCDKYLESGAEVDWGSIGKAYIPERDAAVVKARWNFLQKRRRGKA